jgi:hypothetical protein
VEWPPSFKGRFQWGHDSAAGVLLTHSEATSMPVQNGQDAIHLDTLSGYMPEHGSSSIGSSRIRSSIEGTIGMLI